MFCLQCLCINTGFSQNLVELSCELNHINYQLSLHISFKTELQDSRKNNDCITDIKNCLTKKEAIKVYHNNPIIIHYSINFLFHLPGSLSLLIRNCLQHQRSQCFFPSQRGENS